MKWLECYYVTDTGHIEFFRSFQHFTTARDYAALGDTEKALHSLLLLQEIGKNLNRPLDWCETGTILAALYRVSEVLLAAHSFGSSHKGYMTGVDSKKDKPVRLSKQQTHMLELLALGYKYTEISKRTGLSIPTIKSHTSRAYRKLGVNNAMDAVLKA